MSIRIYPGDTVLLALSDNVDLKQFHEFLEKRGFFEEHLPGVKIIPVSGIKDTLVFREVPK